MRSGSGFNRFLGIVLLVGAASGVSSPAEAGIFDWWFNLPWFDLPDRSKPVSVPEPATLALFATGIAAVGLLRKRRNRD